MRTTDQAQLITCGAFALILFGACGALGGLISGDIEAFGGGTALVALTVVGFWFIASRPSSEEARELSRLSAAERTHYAKSRSVRERVEAARIIASKRPEELAEVLEQAPELVFGPKKGDLELLMGWSAWTMKQDDATRAAIDRAIELDAPSEDVLVLVDALLASGGAPLDYKDKVASRLARRREVL